MNKNAAYPLKLTATLAMLAAISIICGKYLAIRGGDILRFSFENLPIIFAGLTFGPISGILVGVVADLVGCVMVGYTINPIVTVGAAAIGCVAGICRVLLRKVGKNSVFVTIVSVTLAHLIGSVLIKTFGLSAFYDMPLVTLMLWRLLNYVIVGAIECALLIALLENREVTRLIANIKPKTKEREVEHK